jgi:hypothetical protein
VMLVLLLPVLQANPQSTSGEHSATTAGCIVQRVWNALMDRPPCCTTCLRHSYTLTVLGTPPPQGYATQTPCATGHLSSNVMALLLN